MKTYDGSLYQYSNGSYCGVLMKKLVMKKLVKSQLRHLEEVKRILSDEADDGNVFPSMWALHYPNGEQTIVDFIDTSCNVRDRIKSATRCSQPIHKPLVFIADNMKEAVAMADSRLNEL